MKKILLASTALVLSAGLAHAQAVSIGGEGRMGIIYDNAGAATNGGSTYLIENRLQFNFSVSVEADHGLKFGAFTRARMAMGGGTPALFATNQTGVFSGSRVWVEAMGLRLTFGNVDGALRGAGASHGYAGGCGIGYIGGHLCGDSAGLLAVSQGFASTGPAAAQRVRVDYTMGATRVALSHDRGGSTEFGARTTFDAFTVAIGYTNDGGAASAGQPVTTISGSYNGGSWSAGLIVARGNGVTNYSLSASGQVGGGSLYGYVGRVGGASAYGLSYGYGLGGGATLTAGWETVGARDTASIGVAFTF